MWMKENAVYESSMALRIDSWETLAVTNQKRGKDFTHRHTHTHTHTLHVQRLVGKERDRRKTN